MTTASRFALAAALCYVAVCGLPSSTRPHNGTNDPVAEPTNEMQARVKEIGVALRAASPLDRLVWASVWNKAAAVIDGEGVNSEVVFTDTKSLRAFTVIALNIAWRRIGNHTPGEFPGLRDAVEAAFKTTLTLDDRTVTQEVRNQYAELCRAIAWAGIGRG